MTKVAPPMSEEDQAYHDACVALMTKFGADVNSIFQNYILYVNKEAYKAFGYKDPVKHLRATVLPLAKPADIQSYLDMAELYLRYDPTMSKMKIVTYEAMLELSKVEASNGVAEASLLWQTSVKGHTKGVKYSTKYMRETMIKLGITLTPKPRKGKTATILDEALVNLLDAQVKTICGILVPFVTTKTQLKEVSTYLKAQVEGNFPL